MSPGTDIGPWDVALQNGLHKLLKQPLSLGLQVSRPPTLMVSMRWCLGALKGSWGVLAYKKYQLWGLKYRIGPTYFGPGGVSGIWCQKQGFFAGSKVLCQRVRLACFESEAETRDGCCGRVQGLHMSGTKSMGLLDTKQLYELGLILMVS